MRLPAPGILRISSSLAIFRLIGTKTYCSKRANSLSSTSCRSPCGIVPAFYGPVLQKFTEHPLAGAWNHEDFFVCRCVEVDLNEHFSVEIRQLLFTEGLGEERVQVRHLEKRPRSIILLTIVAFICGSARSSFSLARSGLTNPWEQPDLGEKSCPRDQT